MSLSARAIATLLGLVAASGLALALLLGTGDRPAQAIPVPVLASDNVELVASRPGTAAISGVFSRTAPYFYVSGLDSVSVFDVSDPRNPKLTGKLVNAIFENEAMTLGERVEDGEIRRFVLLGNDLVQANVGPAGIERGQIGGGELIVVDVTDPAAPKVVGRTPGTGPAAASTSTHTVACVNPSCSVAYSAGDTGKFSIFDLSDLTAPKQVKEVASPAAKPNPIFTGGSGHHWSVDGANVAWHTGSGGTAAFDISDPMNPQPLNGTDENGTKSPYNDFIHHNSQRPNAQAFRPGRELSVANGNVVLVTEEDYANDGDEVVCERAGTFQTWSLPDLDGAAYRARNPDAEPNKGTMQVLDTINPPADSGGGLSTPVGAFCSAHWFDYHQSGVIAQGFYQQGLRLIDVRNPRKLEQHGYFTGGGTEVWDAYWAPERDASGAVVPGRKTNLVYTVDAVRGVDVFEVDLPEDLPVTGDDGGRGPFPAPPAEVERPGTGKAASGAQGGGASGDGGASGGGADTAASAPAAASPSACAAPAIAIARTSRVARTGLTVRGTAKGCGISQVRVAVARKAGGQCRFLQASGRFGAPRSCARPQDLRARGTGAWSLTRKVRLGRGAYVVTARLVGARGAATLSRRLR